MEKSAAWRLGFIHGIQNVAKSLGIEKKAVFSWLLGREKKSPTPLEPKAEDEKIPESPRTPVKAKPTRKDSKALLNFNRRNTRSGNSFGNM